MNLGKLSEETVLDIFFAAGHHKAIARKYGVSQTCVCNIKLRRVYRRFTGAWDPSMGAERINATLISAAFGVH